MGNYFILIVSDPDPFLNLNELTCCCSSSVEALDSTLDFLYLFLMTSCILRQYFEQSYDKTWCMLLLILVSKINSDFVEARWQ